MVQGAGFLKGKQGWVSGLAGSYQLTARDARHGYLGLGGSKRLFLSHKSSRGYGVEFINHICMNPARVLKCDLKCCQAAKWKRPPPPISREKQILVK